MQPSSFAHHRGKNMNLFRCFIAELKKYTQNLWFPIAVIASTLLCFFSVVYSDPFAGETYTVWNLIAEFSKDEMIFMGENLCAYEVFFMASGEAQTMLIPILVSLPFAIPMALERRTGNLRYSLLRCGTRRFCGANLLAAMSTGGLVLSLSAILFGFAGTFFFPGLADYGRVFDMGCFVSIIQRVAGLFLHGCGAVLLAYLLTFLTTNYYLIVCVPFLIEFLAERTVNWAFEKYLFSCGIYDNWFNCLLPGTLYGVSWRSVTANTALIVYIFLAFGVLLICIGIMERRIDRAV